MKRSLSLSMMAALLLSQCPVLPAFAATSTDDLLGYWKFDETSGSTAADSSGDGKTGTYNNSPTISTTIPSLSYSNTRSLQFAGSPTKNYISTSLSWPSTAGTISAWVYPTSYSDWIAPVAWKLGGATNGYILIDEGGSGSPGRWRAVFRPDNSGNAETTVLALSSITQNQWAQLTMTWAKSGGTYTINFYINGAFQGTTTWTGSVGGSGVGNFNIGRGGDFDDNYFIGNVDDVRVYNRALGYDEVSDLAQGRHPQSFWKGTTDTSYEGPGNWSGSYLPDPYRRVTILARTFEPVMTGAVQVAGLTISSGALLNTNGLNLTMNDTGTFTNFGTLVIKGVETLSGLANDSTEGTVMTYGTGSYTGLPTGTSYYNLTINGGLLGYWKFDEATGTRAADASGYGNSGSLLNGTTITTGTAPLHFTDTHALSFDGTNDYVSLPSGFSDFSRGLTIAVWAKPTNSANWGRFTDFGNGSPGNNILFGRSSSSNNLFFEVYNGASSIKVYGTGALINNEWHHYAVTEDRNGTVTLYKDGARVGGGTALVPSVVTRTLNYIGRSNWVADSYYAGSMDDLRVYNRSLAAGEIAALAAGNEPSVRAGTITLSGLMTINGSLTVNAGTLDVSSSSYGLIVGKNWLNNGGIFLPRSSNVTFTGTTSGLEILSGGQSFAKLTFNGSGGTWNTRDRLTASGTTVLSAGTLDASGSYAMRFGQLAQVSGTIVPRSGVVVLTNHQNTTDTITSTLNSLHIEDPRENGLVGYWKLDEGTNSGAIVDSSGLNPVGVRRGTGAIWTSSVPSAIGFDDPFAMQFNGAPGDAVSIPVSSSFPSNPTNLTQALWMKTTTGCGSLALVTRRNQVLSTNSDWATLQVVNGSVFFDLDDKSYGHATTGVRVDDGLWHHVVGVKSGTTYSLYVDGTFRDSFTDAHSMDGSSGLNYNIGLAPNWTGSNFIGSIDDVRVYNRILSANEIMNLARGHYAAGGTGTTTISPGANLSVGSLVLDSGNLSMGSAALSVSNDFLLSRGNGTLTSGFGSMQFNNVTMSGSMMNGNSGTFDINGNLNILTGSLLAPGYLFLNGNLKKTGGVFTVTNMTLDGNNQTLTGALAFYNLTKTVTSPATLYLAPGYPYTVSGALVLKGVAGNLLSLRSSVSGVAASLSLASIGTQDIQYADIADSDATAGLTLQCLTSNGCLNSGNNTNWFFGTNNTTAVPAGVTSTPTPSGGSRGHGTTEKKAIDSRLALISNFQQQIAQNTPSPSTTQGSASSLIVAKASSSAHSAGSTQITVSSLRGKLLVAMNDKNVLYKDVPVDQWFAPYVSEVITQGIAQGYKATDGTLTGEFGVGNNVTRAEMLKMALEAAKKTTVKAAPPRNASAINTWASSYVGIAESLSLSTFGTSVDVNKPATRGEVVQTIMEIMNITIGNNTSTFSDVPKNSPYTNAIAAAAFFGLVEGDKDAKGNPLNTFRPNDPINRAEVAKIIALAGKVLN